MKSGWLLVISLAVMSKIVMRFSFTVLMTVSLFITQHMASAAPAVEAPTSLAANAVSQSRIDLSWKHSGSGISGFIIERGLSSGSGFSKIASPGSSARSYSNTALSNSQTYYYRVRAYKQRKSGTLYSSYTSVASATTLSAFVPGAFEFSASSYSVSEGAGKVDVVIKRVGGADGAVTVDWRTQGVTATYGADYGDFSWMTLSFADGEASKALSVAIVNDTLVENEEVFNLLLGNPSGGATLGSIATAAVTIEDNDAAPEPEPTPSPSPSPSPTMSLGYLPIFPGAQGFGTETKAGRGGQIIRVTNLNDSGSGSLRAAIAATGPRIIVFEVSGNIVLSDNLVINNPYVTIAGQTAPSPGITLKGAGIEVKSHDVLIQHLRVRVGDGPVGPAPSSRDGVVIFGPNGQDVVIDHVSFSWAIDKNTGSWYDGMARFTLSNCIISEALQNSINPDGPHSKGSLVGDHAKNVSFIGNLWAHNYDRNPLMKGDTSTVVLNNVMYNGGIARFSAMGDGAGSGASLASIVGNVYIQGPNTPSSSNAIEVMANAASGTKLYHSGNRYSGTLFKNSTGFDPLVSSPPVWHKSLIILDSSTVESRVLANAGARPANRDSVDGRIATEVKNRTGYIIDSQQQVGGWPSLANNDRTFTAPANPNGDDDGDGYTNIEEILHQMAAQVEGR